MRIMFGSLGKLVLSLKLGTDVLKGLYKHLGALHRFNGPFQRQKQKPIPEHFYRYQILLPLSH